MPAKVKPGRGAVLDWASPYARGLRGLWLFDAQCGLVVRDLSGYGHHGALTNMVGNEWTVTEHGTGLSLPTSNDNVVVTSTAALQFTNEITVAVRWFVPASPVTCVTASKTWSAWNWNMALDTSGQSWGFRVGDNEASGPGGAGGLNPWLGKWVWHVGRYFAATVYCSVINPSNQIQTWSTGGPAAIPANSDPMGIGNRYPASQSIRSTISDCVIWNRYLRDDELLAFCRAPYEWLEPEIIPAFISAGATVHAGAAALSGVGSIAADPTVVHAVWPAAAALSGAGAVTADPSVIHATWPAAAALAGAGAVTANPSVIHATWPAAAALSGVGTIVADATLLGVHAGEAALLGLGTVTADPSVVHAVWPAAAALAGAGAVAANPSVIHATWPASAALAGAGALTADASVTHAVWAAAAALAGAGIVVADATIPAIGDQIATATWPFATTAEGWTGSGGTGWIMVYRSTEGNPAGSLRAGLFGADRLCSAQWSIAGTWESLFGIPAGATVTQLRMLGLDWRCQSYLYTDELRLSDRAGSNVNGLQYIGSSNLELWAGAQPTAATNWATAGAGTNQAVPVADQGATTPVTFRLNFWGDTANNSSADGRILVDNVSIEITYTTAVIHSGAAILSGVGSLISDGSVIHAVWPAVAALMGVGTLTADGVAFIAPPRRIAVARLVPGHAVGVLTADHAAGELAADHARGEVVSS